MTREDFENPRAKVNGMYFQILRLSLANACTACSEKQDRRSHGQFKKSSNPGQGKVVLLGGFHI